MRSMKEAENNLEKREKRLEIAVCIFLGLTALLVGWAAWIGSVHGGNQNANYTMSNNYASEANAEYNVGSQLLIRDMMTWNVIQDYLVEKAIYVYSNEDKNAQLIQDKVDNLIQTCPEELRDAINWAYEQNEAGTVSPFTKEGMIDSYFAKAEKLLAKSQACMEKGKIDSRNCDRYGLVTVIYSLVLFLLGIVGVFKRLPNRLVVFWTAIVLLVFATAFMGTIPLPTDFSIMDYFKL